MPSVRVAKVQNNGVYFLTFTIKNWFYLLDRYNRWDILASSLEYCRKDKGLKLLSFVFMINHIHLIIESEDVAGFIRDFKRYISKEIRKNIQLTESRVEKLFINLNGEFELWEKTNMPKSIESRSYMLQKINYIEHNPVKRGYVILPSEWYWSSANERCELKTDLFEI